jgi:hypothetical protein
VSEAVITLATGLAAMSALLVAWVAVQRAWRRAFPDAGDDEDALSGRMGCHGGCAPQDCARRCPTGAGAGEEDLP